MIPPPARWKVEDLSMRLNYNPETGVFIWKARTPSMFSSDMKTSSHKCAIWNARYAGKEAGCISPSTGYRVISLDGKRYGAHRLAIFMFSNRWPDTLMVDHINGNRTDNRSCNLRCVSPSENPQNMASRSGSTSQYVGVTFDRSRNKWLASISAQGKRHNLGRFDSEQEASNAYVAAKPLYHSISRIPV